jgi:uncharacterized protein (DUF433 family)
MKELMLFSADQVSRLTGLSKRRLAYWSETDFYKAEHGSQLARAAFGRVYSFLDIVALRTIAVLVMKHNIHLSELRRVASELSDRRGAWAGFKFYVGGRKVFWRRPEEAQTYGTKPPGQIVMPVAMDKITRQMETIVARAQRRRKADFGQITRNRLVVQGKRVIAGTRITTEAIWSFHEDGADAAAIIGHYPRLTPEDITAAIKYEGEHRRKAG